MKGKKKRLSGKLSCLFSNLLTLSGFSFSDTFMKEKMKSLLKQKMGIVMLKLPHNQLNSKKCLVTLECAGE